MTDVRNVFVSHRHEDDGLIADLKSLLKDKVTIRDSSITSDKPNDAKSEAYIKSQILAPGINWAGAVFVLITPDTKNHDWVNWEIEYAERQNKPIIGIWAHGYSGCEVPEALENHADSIVSWNADSIVAALEAGHRWESEDGSPRGTQPIRTVAC